MEVTSLLIRLFLAGLFALAGIGKLLDLKGSDKVMGDFGVPANLARAAGIALSVFEIIIAIAFLSVATSWLAAIASLLLLLAFIGGMIYQVAQGNAPDCHCFGQFHTEPVGKKSIIRNVLFAFLALVLAVQGSEDQGLNLTDEMGAVPLIFGFAVIALLTVALIYLKRILEQQQAVLRRIEMLELLAGEGGEVKRDEAGLPNDGLPIGAPLPHFDLPDPDGELVSFENLASAGKPVLFIFVGPNCGPCNALVPEIEEWRTALSGKLDLILISTGAADENREKFSAGGSLSVLLQTKREVAESVNARWTPTAILVNADGNISSHLAAGDSAIRELIESLKVETFEDEFVYFVNGSANGRKPKIGEAVPEFTLNDLDGREITAEDLRGRKTLATFWSLGCAHCQTMMDELRKWDESRSEGEPELIVFSEGDDDVHKELGLSSPILLETGYKTAQDMGMFGTPSAVLIDEKGRIVSETAVGASNIWALIGKK